MRTETYQQIVDESRVELTPAGAWLLSRLATNATLEHGETKATTPEEVVALTAELLHRGYLTIEPASGRLELSEQGRQANAALVEAGRSVLTRIAADIDPPEEEGADILRRLAVSLLAEIPRDALASLAQQPWPPPHFPDESLRPEKDRNSPGRP